MRTPFRTLPAWAVLSALVGMLVGSGGYTVHSSEATSYLSDDPRACANCHVMREAYDGWQKGSHHAHATCNGCHIPQTGLVEKYAAKLDNGYRHSKGFTLQDFPEPIRITPGNRDNLNSNCRRCHEAMVSELAPEDLDCVRCHARVGHGPTR